MSNLFSQETGPQPPREVRAPVEIFSLLRTLMQSRDALTVTFIDRAQKFQSFIVNVDADKRALWIDEMIPREGDRYAAQGEAFRIDAWHEGIHMRWNCAGASPVVLDDAPAYEIPLPEELIYHQKRGAFRASVRRTADIAVQMSHPERERRFTSYLMDLSATGCKVRLEGDLTKSLQPGEEYNSVLHLPDAGRIDVSTEVRHVVFREDANETHVGLMFKQQTAAAQRSVDRFVNYLQREARRLEKEDLF